MELILNICCACTADEQKMMNVISEMLASSRFMINNASYK
jgi:hypothetical protein